MDVNKPNTESSARHVSGRCFLNGKEVSFVSFSIESNAFRGAGTFELTLAISALPSGMQLLNWWAAQTTIRVELFISVMTLAGINEKNTSPAISIPGIMNRHVLRSQLKGVILLQS